VYTCAGRSEKMSCAAATSVPRAEIQLQSRRRADRSAGEYTLCNNKNRYEITRMRGGEGGTRPSISDLRFSSAEENSKQRRIRASLDNGEPERASARESECLRS